MTTLKIISPQELEHLLKAGKATLIDVREKTEYDIEHIPGSILMPLSQFKPENVPIAPDKIIVFHCHLGKRSISAGNAFLSECDEFETNVLDGEFEAYSLEGGINSWKKAGFPTESNQK